MAQQQPQAPIGQIEEGDPTLPRPEKQSTSIQELQEAFGTILLLRREKPQSPGDCFPRWTGAFRLFDFPRELRDRIYFHYLFRHQGIPYRRHKLRCTPWPFEIGPVLSLFLASHQAYEEALHIFCIYNVVNISYKVYLQGTLRIFPDHAARLVQRVRIPYGSWQQERALDSPGPGGWWRLMLREAGLTKEFFPLLREFQADIDFNFHTCDYTCHRDGILDTQCETEPEKLDMWLRWMRYRWEVDQLVPPPWFRASVRGSLEEGQASFDRALVVFRKEMRSFNPVEALEESGKKWLEETWPESLQRQKRTTRYSR